MIMSVKLLLIDSLRFTKQTFAGDLARSSIFLFLCLCAGLFMSVNFLPKFTLGGGVIWDYPYPWWGVIILGITWVLIWTAIIGYCIRIFRGDKIPPSFNTPVALIKEGFIAQIAVLVWTFPLIICESVILISNNPYLIWIKYVLWIVLLFMIPTMYFLYANTGKFVESIHPLKILSAIRTSGWGNYITAIMIWVIGFLIIACISLGLNFILVYALPLRFDPTSNYVIFGFVSPVFIVFIARLFTNVLRYPKRTDTGGIGNG